MSIIGDIKEVAKVAKQIDNIDLYRQILNLQGEALELMEQVQTKDKEIQDLKVKLELKTKLGFSNGLYYELNPAGHAIGSPYCPACFDNGGKAIHLTVFPSILRCPVCSTQFPRR